MNYRLATIQSTLTLTDDKTDTFNINVKDPISRITLQLRGKNADSVPDGHPAKAISKIELVDGSDVIYSLSGEEAQAADFYDTGKVPLNVVSYVNANIWTCLINMNFGRFLWDTQLALDPNKFDNLQLKVTHKVADTAGSSTTITTSTLAIYAHVFDEKMASPNGFLMNKEIKAYVIGSSGSFEYTNMPTDYPYRRIMLQSLYVGQDLSTVINAFYLTEDNDKRIVFDVSTSNYMKIAAVEYGKWSEAVVCAFTSGTVAFYTAIDYEYSLGYLNTVDADTVSHATAYPLGGRIYLTNEGNDEGVVTIGGYAPHGTIPIFVGQADDIADWYDVTKIGSLVLRLKAGSLGGTATARICVQQYRTY